MVRTNNGFDIADTDLKLRGPGDLMGTQQSGIPDLHIADLGKDGPILQVAREAAQETLREDPELELPQHQLLKLQLARQKNRNVNWERIS